MATTLEATTAIQEKMFSAMQVSHKAMLDGAKAWAETVETVYAKLPDLVTGEPAKPTQLFEATIAFSEKVLASQQEFTAKLFETMMPMAKAAATVPPPKPKP